MVPSSGYDVYSEVYVMRTNIEIDRVLVDQAMQELGTRSMRETVDLALREMLARRKQRAVLDLIGQDLIDPEYDIGQVRRQSVRDPGR